MWKFLIILPLFLCNVSNSFGMNLSGRLGIGLSNQVASGIDAISFKLHRNRSTAVGALLGLDSSSDASNYAAGLKGYWAIYDEPQLNFYSALSGIMFTFQNEEDDTESGYQIEGAFGTEFSFQGLESIGFSFEFGLGVVKNGNSTAVRTTGHSVLVSAVHFYL